MGQTASSGQHGRTEGCFTAGIGLGCCSDVCDGAQHDGRNKLNSPLNLVTGIREWPRSDAAAACGWCSPATDRAGKRWKAFTQVPADSAADVDPELITLQPRSHSSCRRSFGPTNTATMNPSPNKYVNVNPGTINTHIPTESDPELADKRSVHDIRLQEAAEFGKGLKEVARHAAHAVVREDSARKAARHDPRLNVATHQITGKRNLTHHQQNTAPKSKHGNHSHTTHPTRAHGHP